MKNNLKEYIKGTRLIKFSDNFHIRVSEEIYRKYENGLFDLKLKRLNEAIKELDKLNIAYPSSAKPIFYLYIVPFDGYTDLLDIPKIFDNGTGGGKPVNCMDLDGYKDALGYSENIMIGECEFSSYINNIHELAHLVNSMFACKNRFIHEGFADAVPLFALEYEKKFPEYLNMIINLEENDIFSVDELIIAEDSDEFDKTWIEPAINCSFVKGYVSSYLFTRIVLEKICEKYNVTPIDSINIYLNMLKCSNFASQYLVCEIADELGLDKEKLCSSKDYQMELIEKIKFNEKNVRI